jgi:hypothetical protein
MKPIFRVQTVVACVLLGALPAGATTIEIGVATQTATGIGPITTEATGSGTSGAGLTLLPYDGFLITAAASDPNPIDLASATLDVSGGSSKALYVYVTETGLVSNGSALDFQSQFAASVPTGWTETETTFVSTSNTPYGGVQLASMSGSGTKSITNKGVNVGSAGSTFSITEVYEFISSGLGLDASSESISATKGVQAAPAPSLGAGVSSMLAIGAMLLGTKLAGRWRRS